MPHLSLVELARLVDESPEAHEKIHLEECGTCAEQLAGLHRQTLQLSQLLDPPLPPALTVHVRESIMSHDARSRRQKSVWGLRIAAGFVLLLVGSSLGTFVFAPALAGRTSGAEGVVAPTDAAAAASAVQIAEAEYLTALARYAELTQAREGDPLSRLAALEGIVLTTRAALREAPADPLINNYHLTAVGQRDALLRELDRIREDEWF